MSRSARGSPRSDGSGRRSASRRSRPMADQERSVAQDARSAGPAATAPRPSRARVFKEILASLSKVASIRGGLLVTPDGLVITAHLPPRSQEKALAALGATRGRELELGPARLDRRALRMPLYPANTRTHF